MALIPDPCLIETIRRGSGPTRVLVQVSNGSPEAFVTTVKDLSKPNWIDVEGLTYGSAINVPARGRLPVVLNVNTDHRQFPDESNVREEIQFNFEDGNSVSIFVYLQKVLGEPDALRGALALDFGTTNSCYAWKRRVGEDVSMSDAFQPPTASSEIPSLIRFKDISVREKPGVVVGHEARDFIAKNSGKPYSYAISIKRLLGRDQDITVLDERSGMEPGRFQIYKPQEIAGFIIQDLITRAEKDLGAKVEQIVATYPILYNKPKLASLRGAYQKAFEFLNRDWNDDRLILRVDETNAAIFNYVYGQLMDEFRRFATTKSSYRLVSYDFGGGTVDVSVADIDLARDNAGRITIDAVARGLTGDAYFGGDNITLATLQVLKNRLVQRIAEQIYSQSEAAAKAAEEAAAAAAVADDPWALPAEPAAGADGGGNDDPWGQLAQDEQTGEEESAPAGDDPVVDDIYNGNSPEQMATAAEAIRELSAVIDTACVEGLSLNDACERCAQTGSLPAGYGLSEARERIQRSISVLLPTAWSELERQGDLIGKDSARLLFYELWLPSEVLKIKAATSADGIAELTFPLPRLAHYSGVSSDELRGVKVSLAEVEAAIAGRLKVSMAKAAYLTKNISDATPAAAAPSSGGLDFGLDSAPATATDERKLIVLLAGNSSRLPLVRKMAEDLFGVPSSDVVMDPQGVKAAVAQGACEEHLLKQDFGTEGGLIHYRSEDFVDRLPYTAGFFQRELELVGYAGGFAPVVPRGSSVNSQFVVTDRMPVIHAQTTEVPVFGYYHDHPLGVDDTHGDFIAHVEPQSLGWFDLRQPEESLFDGTFNPSVEQEIAGLAEGTIAYVVMLDEEQRLWLIHPESKQLFKLREVPERCDPQEDPFSGIH